MKIVKKERYIKISWLASELKLAESGCYQVDYFNKKYLEKELDLPLWVYEKHKRHVRLITNKLQYLNANKNVVPMFYPYIRAEHPVISSFSRDLKIRNAKAQVTKVMNAIREYEEEQTKLLFWEKENDLLYQKALKKLAEKRTALRNAALINEAEAAGKASIIEQVL